jgi:hypothetical protein
MILNRISNIILLLSAVFFIGSLSYTGLEYEDTSGCFVCGGGGCDDAIYPQVGKLQCDDSGPCELSGFNCWCPPDEICTS